MPVPSDEWICLQFSPVCLLSHTAVRYTGHLEVRHQVQQCQWRKEHEDAHYAACLFCYEREYAVLMRSHSIFACIANKHRVKIGEPDAPVASAEQGGQLIVHSWGQLQAADHNLCCVTYQMKLVAHGTLKMLSLHSKKEHLNRPHHYTIQQSLQKLLTIELKTSQFFSSIRMVALTIE